VTGPPRSEATLDQIPAVGIAGLGRMGTAAAAQLLRSGHQVVATSRRRHDPFVAAGGRYVSPTELPATATVILSFLPVPGAVQEAVDAWLPGLTDDHVVVDCSNLPADAKRSAWSGLAPVPVLDAPVHGPPAWVDDRRAQFFASGPSAALESALPVLRAITDHVHVVGGFGAGAAMKAAVNLLRFVEIVSTAEAMRLAECAGVPVDVAADILVASWGGSPEVERRAGRMARREYTPAGGTLTDVSAELAQLDALARLHRVPASTFDAARATIAAAETAGFGDHDVSSVIELLRRPPAA
jgi:3-hydroxyisobutyrate dehydrogenase